LAATSSNRSKYDSSRGKIRSFTWPPVDVGSTRTVAAPRLPKPAKLAEPAGDVTLDAPVDRAVKIDEQE
jgi:hypothetical protein